jgi:Domain of unknown function (DUF397)
MSDYEVQPQWQSPCGNGTCVEVAEVAGRFLIRDSKNPDAAPLDFSADEWNAFVTAVKDDQFQF